MAVMKRAISRLLLKMLGWQVVVTQPDYPKCVICVAPHTSNWDFFIGKLAYLSIGRFAGFMMKKEWFFWPLGPIFKAMGGIPVWRSKNCSMTDNLAEQAKKMETFHLSITPEGTRSLNPEWKKGAYYIALKAQIPLLLYGVDYEKREIVCTKSFIPTGDIDNEMRELKLYYKDFKGKHPELFTIGEV